MEMASPRRKPSQRPKRRYIVFEVVSSESLGMQDVADAMQRSLADFQNKGMKFINDTWDSASKQGIVRVQHTHAKPLCDALRNLSAIGTKKIRVQTLGTSGILRRAKLKFMKNKTIKKENKRNYHHRVRAHHAMPIQHRNH